MKHVIKIRINNLTSALRDLISTICSAHLSAKLCFSLLYTINTGIGKFQKESLLIRENNDTIDIVRIKGISSFFFFFFWGGGGGGGGGDVVERGEQLSLCHGHFPISTKVYTRPKKGTLWKTDYY
jgi:hypothetical protein